MAVDVTENLAGGSSRTGVRMGDAVGNRHEDGGRRAVPTHVGDQNAPFAVRQRKEIVIVAACSARGLVESSQVQGRDTGQLGRKQGALNVRDHLQFVVQGGVGRLQIRGENQVARRSSEKITYPH